MSHFLFDWVMQTYPTNEYKTFEDAFEALMAEPVYRESPPESAALACAGKVIHPSPLDRLLKCSLVCDARICLFVPYAHSLHTVPLCLR